MDTPGIARGVAVDGNFADLADGSPAGVLVFDGFESGDTLMWAPR